jgi:hypothetical protein
METFVVKKVSIVLLQNNYGGKRQHIKRGIGNVSSLWDQKHHYG